MRWVVCFPLFLFLFGCATAASAKGAVASSKALDVTFSDPYSPKDLYVCGTLDGHFTCIEYGRFLEELAR